MQIESGLYQRQGKAITNFVATLPSPQSDLAQESLKDPYLFDFLTLHEDAVERDLEHGLAVGKRPAAKFTAGSLGRGASGEHLRGPQGRITAVQRGRSDKASPLSPRQSTLTSPASAGRLR